MSGSDRPALDDVKALTLGTCVIPLAPSVREKLGTDIGYACQLCARVDATSGIL
jgi:hypothetical protein